LRSKERDDLSGGEMQRAAHDRRHRNSAGLHYEYMLHAVADQLRNLLNVIDCIAARKLVQ
jgi:hypothetical protein